MEKKIKKMMNRNALKKIKLFNLSHEDKKLIKRIIKRDCEILEYLLKLLNRKLDFSTSRNCIIGFCSFLMEE